MAKTAKKRRELKIVFDTNALYSQAFGELLNQDLGRLIRQHSKHLDLRVSWLLPDIVRNERQFQMERDAHGLLPHIAKVEQLLTLKLNITADNLSRCVSDAVDRAMAAHSLTVLPLSHSRVDWPQLVHRSSFRLPPFEYGKTEKGFRDALIGETFMQLAEDSPRTPSICLLALVTNDGKLGDWIAERAKDHQNVRIVRKTEELEGLINTLVSQVSEEVVTVVKEKAEAFFFIKGNEDTYFFREKLMAKLKGKFRAQLETIPTGADAVEQSSWYIAGPEFIKKEGRRFHWATRITVVVKATRTEFPAPDLTLSSPSDTGGITFGPSSRLVFEPKAPSQNALAAMLGRGLLGGGGVKKQLFDGKVIFRVEWSADVNQQKKLSASRIDSLDYVETVWVPVSV